jgi:hypothetical protein
MKLNNRRSQRVKLANSIFAQYLTPCLWCSQLRPGKEPNMVESKVQGSHGICKECAELMIQQTEQ